MRKIQPKLRDEIANNGIDSCEVGDSTCFGHLEWHHPWIYAGRQINEPWAILKICTSHHDRYHAYEKEVVRTIRITSLSKASNEDLKKYPKVDWERIKKYLNMENKARQDDKPPF